MAKILIVDDSAVSRKLLMRILDNTEHEVIGEAENGEKAIIQYRKLNPDIIMMDLDMPGIGGLEAAKKIKANYPSVKIIIVSAHEQSSITNELGQNGINYFVTKPFNSEKVAIALNSVLSEKTAKKVKVNIDTSKPEINIPSVEKIVQADELDLFGQLDFNVGKKVSVTHVSTLQDIKGLILKKEINKLTLKLVKDAAVSNFSVDDPITIGFEAKSEYYICEANITSVNLKERNLTVQVTKICNLQDDQILEYYPTSLPVNIKEEFQPKSQAAIIKNLGVYNLLIKGKAGFFEGSKVAFDMYLESKVFNLSAEIVSKTEMLNSFEYGAKVTFIDLSNKKFLSSCIRRLRNQQIEAIFNLNIE